MYRKVSRRFWSELDAAQGMPTNWRDVVQRRVCPLVLCRVVVKSRAVVVQPAEVASCASCCCAGWVEIVLAMDCCMLVRKDALLSMSDSFFCIYPVLSTLINTCVCVCLMCDICRY